MKTTILLSAAVWVCFFLVSANAQDSPQQQKNQKEARIKALVDTRHYTFEAQTAMPMSMRNRILSSGYELKVSKDTLEAYLPYFGKAYAAPLISTEGGIQFKTTDFEYVSNPDKKGGWKILIKPRNVGETRQMNLYVSASGYATLQVLSNNRQPISFNGYIR